MADPVTFARKLRREQTLPERRFWALILPWRDTGLHWRRQAPIGPCIVDFVCKGRKLVVEIDGDMHFADAGVEHDVARTAYLERRGYHVLRFNNDDVMQRGEGVFAVLMEALGEPGRES